MAPALPTSLHLGALPRKWNFFSSVWSSIEAGCVRKGITALWGLLEGDRVISIHWQQNAIEERLSKFIPDKPPAAQAESSKPITDSSRPKPQNLRALKPRPRSSWVQPELCHTELHDEEARLLEHRGQILDCCPLGQKAGGFKELVFKSSLGLRVLSFRVQARIDLCINESKFIIGGLQV